MSRCSKKVNEINKKIYSIGGLNDDFVYSKLLEIEKFVYPIIDEIDKYADEDILNGTCFKEMRDGK